MLAGPPVRSSRMMGGAKRRPSGGCQSAAPDGAARSVRAIAHVERPRRASASQRPAQTRGSAASAGARASLECVHDLQFKSPAFMRQQHRRKVFDPKRDPVDDQYYAAFAVRCDSAAQLVVEHVIPAD